MEKDCYITHILGRFRAGDEKAILDVYNTYRKKFVGVLYNKYHGQFNIPEIVTEYQECLSIFYEYVVTKPDFTVRSSIGTYLIQMGKNRLNKKYREMRGITFLEEIAPETLEFWVTDVDPLPEATTDKASMLYAYMDQMAEPGATMFELYLQGMSYKAICGELSNDFPELSPGAIKARIYRSVKKFRKWMVDDLPRGQDG